MISTFSNSYSAHLCSKLQHVPRENFSQLRIISRTLDPMKLREPNDNPWHQGNQEISRSLEPPDKAEASGRWHGFRLNCSCPPGKIVALCSGGPRGFLTSPFHCYICENYSHRKVHILQIYFNWKWEIFQEMVSETNKYRIQNFL